MSETAPPEFTDLDPFVSLLERRLYKQLVTLAECQLAKVERGDAFVPSEAAMAAVKLLEAARKVRQR